jgi:hypothetical protein
MVDVHDGRSAAPLLDAVDAQDLRARRPLRLSRATRHESFDARAPSSFPQKDRGAIFELVNQTIENAI